jgi:hypothetical protein
MSAAETRCVPTIHEPSAWMRGAAAKRVRQIEDLHLDTRALIIAPLGRVGTPGSREDRECDRCGVCVREGDLLHLFGYYAAPKVIICCGLCGRCARKEGA